MPGDTDATADSITFNPINLDSGSDAQSKPLRGAFSRREDYIHVDDLCCDRDIITMSRPRGDTLHSREECEVLCNEAAQYSETLPLQHNDISMTPNPDCDTTRRIVNRCGTDCTHYVWRPIVGETTEDGEVAGTCTLKMGAPSCARDPKYAPNDQKPWDQCFVHPFWEI